MWVGANHECGISMHDMGEPTNSNTNFALMVTDFKYLITEAIFSDTAKLGSSYICGDWQISTYGILYDANNQAYVIDATSSVTIDGVTYTKDNAYTKFDADFTDYSKDGAINFAPNYAVDLLTGNGSFMNVTIRNSLFFNKTVNSKFNSIPSVTMPTEEYYALTDGTYELMIEDDYSSFKMRGNIYMLGGIFNNDGSNKDKRFMINLPPAKLCHGMQITFFNNTTFDEIRTHYEIGVPLDFYVDFDEFGIEAIESSGLSVCYNGFYDPFNVAEIEKGLSSYKNESWWLPKNIRKLTFTAGVNPDAYKDGQGNSDAWRDKNCIAWILTDYEYQQ
jgi:hypothetical protein